MSTMTHFHFRFVLVLLSYTIFMNHVLPVQTLSIPPLPLQKRALFSRQDGSTPVFPQDIPSCPICSQNFASINSCAAAAPVFANFSSIIFNPGAFISVIECACADTFRSAYPQCVDCFTQTNQTAFLNVSSDDTPSILQGIRNVCALESVLLGNASNADGETTPSSAPAPSATTSAGESVKLGVGLFLATRVIEGVAVALACILGWSLL